MQHSRPPAAVIRCCISHARNHGLYRSTLFRRISLRGLTSPACASGSRVSLIVRIAVWPQRAFLSSVDADIKICIKSRPHHHMAKSNFDRGKTGRCVPFKSCDGLCVGLRDRGALPELCVNDLEQAAFDVLPSLLQLKERLIDESDDRFTAVFMTGMTYCRCTVYT